MGSFALGAQVLLAGVFLAAGVAKLLDQPGSRRALTDFGVPERAAPVAGLLLPLAELATAVALVVRPSARWGAVAALALLVVFIAGIVTALSHGRAPDCHCFGQIHSAPAGRGTLLRNGALAALAAVVAWHGPGPSIDDWVAARTAGELVAVCTGVLAAVLAVVAVRQWRDNQRMRRNLNAVREASDALPPGLPLGARAPGFELPDLRGNILSLGALRDRGRPVALVFVSPACAPCATLLPELSRWQTTLTERVTIALVSNGSAQANRPVMDEHGLADVLLQDNSEVIDAYRVRATPSAVVVGADGTIESAPAEGPLAIEPLIRVTLHAGATAKVGPLMVEHRGRSEQQRLS